MPAYLASKETLSGLRRRATVAGLIREIECGKWKKFLIDLKKAKHRYKEIQSNSGKLEALVVKVNAVRMAIRFHTMVLTGTPATISVPDGFDAQRIAISGIRSRSMFDALLIQVARRANIEAFSTMRVEALPGLGTVLYADNNANILPVGPDGPDMQPTVWERRWVIERAIERGIGGEKKQRYLRVERHRAPGGVGIVEHEAYETTTDDIYQFLGGLKEVDLASAMPGTELVASTPTGTSYPLITRFVHEYYDGQPEMLMGEDDLDMIDLLASSMSRVARSMELHGSPKARVDESMIDPETNTVNITEDGVLDPDKVFEYIVQNFKLDDMIKWMNKSLQLVLVQLQLSPALVGVKLEGGQMPDTVDKLRLEASTTLARGRTSAIYFQDALGRVFNTAIELDVQRPMQGYPVAPAGVSMHPGLPRDPMDIAREMTEMRNGGANGDPLIDKRTALENIHGQSSANSIYDRLVEEQQAQLEHDRSALMLSVPGQPGGAGFGGGA